MDAHMKEMESLLCLDSDEVRMIGIWGPSGIGKTTIARVLYSQFSENFELSIFMENIKELMYTRPMCSDEYNAKIQLQKQFLSQIINHKDMELPHLGVAQDRLNDKRVLIVLDSIDQSIQLDAIAKETRWFGHGSRIIITTQDQKLLKAHGINHIYKVEFPSAYEAYQMFCIYAFGQNFPNDGFEELAWQVTKLLGHLPLGLRVMGSHFRGMSRHEWVNALPRLKIRLDASIQSILKFSYDALCEEDKDLFLHIACLFNNLEMVGVEDYLALSFLDVRQGFHLLAEKSLINLKFLSTKYTRIEMHNLLVQLGRDIVRHKPGHQSICEPGKRQFLVDARDICEILIDNTPLGNLKRMYLSESKHLKVLPDLSTATNLEDLNLFKCSSLPELPSSIGNATNLRNLNLEMCTSLVELPSSMGSLYKLKRLGLQGCSKLEELPTNINLESLTYLDLTDCLLIKSFPEISTNIKDLRLRKTAIKEVPSTIKSWSQLRKLEMSYSENLKELPHALDIITSLYFNDTEMQEIPQWVKEISHLQTLMLEGCKRLITLPQLSYSLSKIHVRNCESLERLNFSFENNPERAVVLVNCFKLNKEAREFIQTSSTSAILPSTEVPTNFTYRANGSSIMVNLNHTPLSTTLRFRACVLLDKKVDNDTDEAADRETTVVFLNITEKGKIGVDVSWRPGRCFLVPPILREHLLTFQFEADVTSNKLLFSFNVEGNQAVIKECGVFQL
ncbi:hypothetical protein AXX17_AT5G35610 [Arabidopsis thaliana]|uniref:ADP-ribosyl cyclase/cyclic ADP-ribose hydrolase n=1 Tax=Arabidopsis thaliana TaxID=3702 RepID=A0A178UST3_ARATH|nr:hypothetical protein AXX17_AT5G35610 [Arabidopsis thaliana]